MGEVFAVPYARLEPWPDALSTVRVAGFTVLAVMAAPDAWPIQRKAAVACYELCCDAPPGPAPGGAQAEPGLGGAEHPQRHLA
jgi:hypothetical protein